MTPTGTQFIHVQVGDKNWNPSQDELDKLTKLFKEAAPSLPIVVTDSRVKITLVDKDGPHRTMFA